VAPYIVLENLNKAYGANKVLDGFDLTINKGDLVAFLGPSGCGKTTALRLIAGLTSLDQGRITIGGRDITAIPPNKRNTTMVFQSYALFPHMTVADNIGFGLKMHGVPKEEAARRISKIIDTARLRGLEDRFPRQLSGGQAQRTALARALVMNPDVLLLDEPLSNLDAKLRHEMRVEIRLLHETLGLTTVFVTHDQDEALTLADRIVLMHNGKIVQSGSPREVFETPRSYFVADFTAVRNFFTGGFAESGSAFITGGGLRIECAARDDTKTIVGIRPNKIALNPPNPEDFRNSFKAVVRLTSYRGNVIDVLADLGGREITAEVPAASYNGELKRGSEITLAWHSRDSILLEE
jgi:putative spermidine/putrescine transport system ATP-binding protein